VSDNVRQLLAKGPITGFQLGAIAMCVGLNMLDGFDVLAMAFSASGVKAAWGLTDLRLGWLLSAGLIGMAAGSLALAPLADFMGRRRIILVAAAVAALGMLGSMWARDFTDLLTLRVITGIGIGATIASAAVVVSEYSSDRWRATALAAYSTGYPVGATLGGALTAHYMPEYGWRSAFAIGGVMSLLMALIAIWGLPESLDFLITRRPPGALTRLNALLARMGQRTLSALPEAASEAGGRTGRVPLELLLTGRTLLVWLMFFATMAAFYFSVSWTPRLLNAAGASAALGLAAGVLFNLGGIAGCGGFTLAATRFDAHRLQLVSLLASAVLVAAFGVALDHVDIALWTALLLGLITNAAMSGLYAVAPPLYPAAVRASGMGWAVGVGRLGAILAPILAGALHDAGWAPGQLYFLFAVPLVVAAIAMLGIGLRQGS
jgi:benzoate transport